MATLQVPQQTFEHFRSLAVQFLYNWDKVVHDRGRRRSGRVVHNIANLACISAISLRLKELHESSPLVFFQTADSVRPDLLPFLGWDAILDDVFRFDRRKVKVNIASQESAVFLGEASIGIDDYLVLKFRDVSEARPTLLIHHRVLAFRIKNQTTDIRICRIQFGHQKLDKIRLPIACVREDVGPATNQTLHIERYLVVGFAIPVKYDAAKCKTTQYGRLLGWINSQGTNQPDSFLGRNSDASAQVAQPP